MGKRSNMVRGKKVVAPPRCCWGAQIQCVSAEWCSPNFVAGARHFKTKFCSHCRQETAVPWERVRALNDRLEKIFVNRNNGGLWTALPEHLGGWRYRVINHSKGCIGAHLVIFETVVPAMDWPPLPQSWIADDGHVHLFLSKGTLVPTALRRLTVAQVVVPSSLMRVVMQPPSEGELPLPSSPVRVQEAQEEEEEEGEEEQEMVVEVEAVDEHFALAPLSAFDDDGDSPAPYSSNGASASSSPTPLDAVAQKRMTRMMRNRQSAAASRERKREYIASLEGQVHELSNFVKKLREENSLLRAANLCPDEHTLWSAVLGDQQY